MHNSILKKAQHPDEFIKRDDLATMLGTPSTMALLHTRMPTSGGRGDDQAQPFRVGDTTTVHNGMYTNCPELKKKFGLTKTSGVDSELATAFIAAYGIKALPDYFDAARGPSALGIHHEGNLYLARDGNPIEYLHILDGGNDIIVFASTEGILMSAVKHAWLIPTSYRTTFVPYGMVSRVTPKKLESASRTYASYSYGTGCSDEAQGRSIRPHHRSGKSFFKDNPDYRPLGRDSYRYEPGWMEKGAAAAAKGETGEEGKRKELGPVIHNMRGRWGLPN